MDQPDYPWRASKDLAELLAEAKPVLASLHVVEQTGEYSTSEIDAVEQRLGRPLPDDVRAFYLAMRPTELFAPGSDKEFGFYTIGSKELTWMPLADAYPPEDWDRAQGLFLGQSRFGDRFWWVEGHRIAADGSIFLLDHDGGMGGNVMFVHFARSFREFLAKLTHFRNLYSTPTDELFRAEHVELNPSANP